MKPTRLQHILAHGLELSVSVGALLLASGTVWAVGRGIWGTVPAGSPLNEGGFLLPLVLGILITLPIGGLFGALLFRPLVCTFASKLNGAPFEIGDEVQILTGCHRDRIVRVYQLWPSRNQVRVELGEEEEQKVTDVYSYDAICRCR